ncbi:cyclic phosphodiesterase [Thecamonas trahens ATCC 50062]|uniref:Cyclic phosphodiesterase n=1 Tax=Thecamonas trahens ATCC 50062 TaxID=461836 RepID=A0A0L0D267_THETB|nr:cyclic phosphodiesterase [Thecamonas trahens ATCC 50062]KNC46215.1 cyclic phosphodiesterase [Thecamonas trahens ATCC 50062]|eukprot:XP_013760512.1 cyclic phosphodiesterase [Thecamonas trahens ATCC 50062]
MSSPTGQAFSGYSLWLVPPEPVAASFAATIVEASAEVNTPPFPPHVTLLGGLPESVTEADARRGCEAIAAAVGPYEMVVTGVDVLPDSMFRCVFLRIDPTADVLAAFETAKTALAVADVDKYAGYMPHLSLVYADIDLESRERMAAAIGPKHDGESFTVSRLELWDTAGVHSEWSMVAAYELAGGSGDK